MTKIIINREQYKEIEKLIEVALNQDVEENVAKSKILETHIRKGWEGTEIKTLGELSTDAMATVLFSDNYEVKREKLKLQEYKVTFTVNKHTEITNRVLKYNSFKISEDEAIELSLNNLSDYKELLKLDKESVVRCEVIQSKAE